MFRLMFAMAAAVSASLFAAPASAHPEDEFGAYRGPTTSERAQVAIAKLVSEKKLPASWNNATLVAFDYRTKNGVDQYVVTFQNPAVKQSSKRKLYVIMTTGGEFISAGYKLI